MSTGFYIGALIILAIIASVVIRGLQMKRLANDGVVGKGKVIKKFRRQNSQGGRSSGYLRYEYVDSLGVRHERKIAVGEEVYESYDVDDLIDIVYLANKPRVSAAKYMVNLSREALKLPPL